MRMFWILICIMPAAAVEKMDCPQSSQAITVDGNGEEWAAEEMVFLDKQELSIATRRDDQFLYLYLHGDDPGLGRMVGARGLTVWFDPGGKKKQVIGLRLPGRFDGEQRPRGDQGRHPDREPDADRPKRDEALFREFMDNVNAEIEVVGAEGAMRQRLPADHQLGVAMVSKTSRDGFSCELRIPLQQSEAWPHAINADGDKIGVGILSPKPEGRRAPRSQGGPRAGGGPGGPGGGAGGPRMGGGPGRGEGPGGRPPGGERPPSLDIWLRLKLT